MSYFTADELKLIQSLTYNPKLMPYYDAAKDCLIWEDERCDIGLSSLGYEKLCDLWIARSFVHLNKPFSTHPLDPNYFREVWKSALSSNFDWPGFKRLELSERDKKYFLRERQEHINSAKTL